MLTTRTVTDAVRMYQSAATERFRDELQDHQPGGSLMFAWNFAQVSMLSADVLRFAAESADHAVSYLVLMRNGSHQVGAIQAAEAILRQLGLDPVTGEPRTRVLTLDNSDQVKALWAEAGLVHA